MFLPSLELNVDRAPRTAAARVVIPWLCMASGVMLLVQQVEQYCRGQHLKSKLEEAAAHPDLDVTIPRSYISAPMLLISLSLAAGGAAFTERSFVWVPAILLCLIFPVLAQISVHNIGSTDLSRMSLAGCCAVCILATIYLRRIHKPLAPTDKHSHVE